MPNVVFFSFKEEDRGVVLTIKGRAVNPNYPNLNFNGDLGYNRKSLASTGI